MSTFTLNVNLFSNIMAQEYNDNNYNNNYGDDMYSKHPTDVLIIPNFLFFIILSSNIYLKYFECYNKNN